MPKGTENGSVFNGNFGNLPPQKILHPFQTDEMC